METDLERILTNSYKAEMISHLKSHPEDFEEAIILAVSDKQPYSQKAAWLLWSCMEENDPRIQGYIKRIIETLKVTGDSQLRDLLIILEKMELDENIQGELFEICVDVWEKIGKKASLRYNAFKLIVKTANKYPELYNEVKYLTQDQYTDSFSKTAQKSIFKMISELETYLKIRK